MASTIITKYGSGAPLASDLVRGELAVDTENGRLYTETSGGAVVEIGLNPGGNVDVTGVVQATGYLAVEGTTGNTGLGTDRWIGGDGTAGTWFYNVPTGSNHYFGVNNSNILAINSTGIDVTGTLTADGLTSVSTTDTQGKFSGWSVVGANGASGAVELGQNSAYQGVISYSADASTRFIFDNTYGSAGSTFEFRTNTSATPKTHLKIDGSGDISFYEDTGTTAKLFWDASTESLGIGTTSPTSLIDVRASAETDTLVAAFGCVDSASDRVRLDIFADPSTSTTTLYGAVGGGTDNTSELAFATRQGASGQVEAMRIDSSGNVGIGTSSPSAPLDIVSSATGGTTIELDNTSTGGRNFTLYSSGSGNSFGAGNFAIYDANAAAVRMLVDSSGNVITGSATANNADAVTLRQDGTVHANNVQVANAGGSVGGTTPSIYSPVSSTLAISTGSTERMRIDSSGNVGIGTAPDAISSNATTLNIKGLVNTKGGAVVLESADESVRSYFYPTSTGTQIGTLTNHDFLLMTNSTEAMRLDSSGHVIAPYGVTLGTAVGTYNAANTLDDYEEGTFTPTMIGTTTTGVGTYDFQYGAYTKVGNLVTINVYIRSSAHTGTGNLRVSNLPFTVETGSYNYAVLSFGEVNNLTTTANTMISGYVQPASTAVTITQITTGSTTVSTNIMPMDAACTLLFSCSYRAA